jgi:hypothetical protein
VAVTVVLFSKKTVQLAPFVVLQPCQDWNPLAGVAVSVTDWPVVNCELQLDPVSQLIPAGELVTFPLIVPVTVTVRIGCGPAGVHPRLAGPFTVTGTALLITSLGLS